MRCVSLQLWLRKVSVEDLLRSDWRWMLEFGDIVDVLLYVNIWLADDRVLLQLEQAIVSS